MPITQDYLNFVQDQLSVFGVVQVKKMFGAASLYHNGVIFACADNDIFYLKADAETRPDFEKRDMPQFNPMKGKKGMPYWQVPGEVLEDREMLAKWAETAYQAALRLKK